MSKISRLTAVIVTPTKSHVGYCMECDNIVYPGVSIEVSIYNHFYLCADCVKGFIQDLSKATNDSVFNSIPSMKRKESYKK